jgi:hypothetical protein
MIQPLRRSGDRASVDEHDDLPLNTEASDAVERESTNTAGRRAVGTIRMHQLEWRPTTLTSEDMPRGVIDLNDDDCERPSIGDRNDLWRLAALHRGGSTHSVDADRHAEPVLNATLYEAARIDDDPGLTTDDCACVPALGASPSR